MNGSAPTPAALLDETSLAQAATSDLLAAVVESSDDAIISKTLEGVITSWNPGAQRIFGYEASEAIGRPVTILIPPELQGEEPLILQRLRAGERIEHYETVRVRKDGTRIHISLSVSPVRDAAGTIVGAAKIARDITLHKAIERQTREQAEILQQLYSAAQREIERRERAEAALRDMDRRKDEFLATLAHELRNPLAPIRQAAVISAAAGASDAQRRWSHDVIARQVQNMSALLEDLLDVSRITRGTLQLRIQATDLKALVDSAVETARPIIQSKRHQLRIELPPQPVRLLADPLRMSQLLSNLLNNAAKYSDPGGQIRVRGGVEGTEVVVRVCDDGIGITADSLHAVFDMFTQVKAEPDRSEGGLGIGLALSKGIATLHGGSIEARSPGPGQGSEFIVRIPVRDELAPPARPPARDASHGTPKRVLIADDNSDNAESLCLLLQMEGHEVTVVHDGVAAIQAFDAAAPDVMLLDIGMPKLDGYAVARHVRSTCRGARPPVLVAITGRGHDADKAKAEAAGFDRHFTKPIEPSQVLQLLRASA